jgi:hypothetical protein
MVVATPLTAVAASQPVIEPMAFNAMAFNALGIVKKRTVLHHV